MAKIILIVDMAVFRKSHFDTGKSEKSADGRTSRVITTSFETMKPLLEGGAKGLVSCREVPAEFLRVPGLILRRFDTQAEYIDYRNKTLYQPMPTAFPEDRTGTSTVADSEVAPLRAVAPISAKVKWAAAAAVLAAAAGAAYYFGAFS